MLSKCNNRRAGLVWTPGDWGVRNDINFAKQQQPVSYVDDLVVFEVAFEDVFNISSD